MAKQTDDIIDDEITRGDSDVVKPDDEPTERQPIYQMMPDSKVPVSKSHGMLWKSRRDTAMSRRKRDGWPAAWDEAIRYYRNDQSPHRDADGDETGEYAANEGYTRHMHRRMSETENIVFANTTALVPSLYAKNPTVEFTAVDSDDNALGEVLNVLVPRIFNKRSAPGINLKPKVRKSVVMCNLTNAAYVEIGYTFREQSSEQAMHDLQTLGKQLSEAKDVAEVERIEGALQALEESVDMLRPAGPWARFRRPHDVLWDIDSSEEDRCDAKWCMIADHVPTTWLNAVYGKRMGDTHQYKSIFEPTHILNAGASDGGDGHNSAEMEINQYTLLDDDELEGHKAYGYDDEESFNKAKRTKVWYVWDKVTRRVFLFNDRDWKFPLWVWDDPYNLQQFFPIYKLQFYTDPEDAEMRGEVTYYLDQQDAINTINSELAMARQWARRNIFFDKNRVSKDEVEAMLKGDNDGAIGVDIPEGMTLKDFILPMLPPSMQIIELFDKKPLLEAIDRVSSVQPVMRGIEFKTNTTNEAINKYNSIQQTRMDEKIDAVEDFIGGIGWGIAQLCLQFMSLEEVATLIGARMAEQWQNLDAKSIEAAVQMIVVGGSTQKQTSESKKQQALNMGQVLGQFVNAAPIPVMTVLINNFRAAFNDVIPEEQWQMILQSLQQQAQQPQQPPQGAGQPAGGEGAPAAPSGGGTDLNEIIQQLPPEAQQALMQAVQQGVPPEAALQRIMGALQQQQGTA